MMRMDSPFGELTLVAGDAGLRAVLWPADSPDRVEVPLDTKLVASHPVLDTARTQLNEYFAGKRTDFDLPFDLHGTDFQRAAWQALATIPYGATASYAQQADRIGKPKAVRAVGAANGRNPISIILPCHRVVGSNGSLVGYAAGLDIKQRLLEHERRNLDPAKAAPHQLGLLEA